MSYQILSTPICLGYFSEILFVEEYNICASSYIFFFKDSSCCTFPRTWNIILCHTGVVLFIPIVISYFKFISDLRQVDGFLRVLRFPPPIKLTATI